MKWSCLKVFENFQWETLIITSNLKLIGEIDINEPDAHSNKAKSAA